MKHRLVFKLFSFISTFSILFNSFYAPLYILAQEQQALEPTPTPAESPTTPVPSDNPATPIPTEDPTPALTDAPVTSTPTPTDNLMTPTPTSTFQPTDESTPLVSPSGTVLGEASQITPTPSGNEEIEGEKKLDVFVLENTDANDVEEELLPDFDYTELSSATLTTDKFDYAPTDAVVITGSGFASNTTYELVITSATGNFRFSDNVLSNESGGFIYTYQLDGVYRPEYKVEVLRGGVILATVTFTDDAAVNLPFSDSFGTVDKNDVLGWDESYAQIAGGGGEDTPRDVSTNPKFAKIGREGDSDGYIRRTINATGYIGLILKYYWKGDADAGNKDKGVVEYCLGSSCTSGFSQLVEHSLSNTSWNESVITLPSSLSNTIFRIRFRNNANGENEYFRVDDVEIYGYPSLNWPNSWQISSCSTDPAGDESPDEVDIVGSASDPAVGFNSDSNYQYFRERLNGDPGTFKQKAWVVLFQTSTPQYQYIVSLNGKDDKVQLWQNTLPSGSLTFNPILNDPAETKIWEGDSSVYARRVSAGGGNYFVDWAIPKTALAGTGINDDTTKFFATSADANNFNKDHLDCYGQPIPTPSATPTPTPSPSPTPAPYCGDGVKNGQEECDGADGVTQGQNFCTSTCKLVPIYDGAHSCPAGTVKSQNPILTKTISSTDADGETFSLTIGGKYLFEASGTFRPTSPVGWYADAGYTTNNSWSSLATQYGIQGTGNDYAAHALLANLGSGVGVVDWGNYNPNHIYTKYYKPTTNNVQFLIGDRYGDWFNTSWQNQTGMGDNDGSLTLNVYECQPVSEVKVCKYDNTQNPLPGWRVYLLGEKLNSFSVPSNGSVVNAGTYPAGSYALLASGVYNYGDSRMNADAANSYRYVGLPCAGATDGWINGESVSCMQNYLSLNFSASGGPTAPGWGNYFNPEHKYAKAFSGGDLKMKIWDTCSFSQPEGCYGDNEGSLNLDVYKGYVGDTGQDGCVTFSDVPYGDYQLGEILKEEWEYVSGQGKVGVDNSVEQFVLVNKVAPKYGNLQVEKIVDWRDVNPDTSKTFEICITGPSYPEPNCKSSDYDGGVLSWNNVLVGEYNIVETDPGPNWIVTGNNQDVVVNSNQTTSVEIKNEINPIIIKGYKVVCDSEQYLPNWGNHGALIGATTAQDYVNNSQGHCHLDDGWKFQYGKKGSGSSGAFQTNTSELGSPWVSFGPTVSGEATAVIGDISDFGGRVETREVFKDNSYVPFSNNDSNNVSAEFYCTGDVYHYDNWEWINNPQYGQTYYCVAFNAPNYGSISGYKWEDLDGNGVWNKGEPTVDGTTIPGGLTIFIDSDGDGQQEEEDPITYIDSDGSYSFGNLIPGNYNVCERDDLLTGWVATSPRCQQVTVAAGQETKNVNFGNFKLGKIYGYKYDEDGKTGLNGWSIFIDGDKDGKLDEGETVVQTGSSEWQDGYFEFTGLTAGKYSICEEEQQGWQRMYPLGTNCQSVSISSGSETKIDFQNRKVVLGLTLTKSNNAPTTSSAGSQVAYTLVIKNTGNQDLTGVIVKDAPAGGFTYVAGSGKLGTDPITPTISGGYLEWYIGVLGAGEEKTLTYKMQSDPTLVAGIYPNVAIATGIYIPSEYVPPESSEAAIFKPLVVEALAVTEEAETPSEGERVESNAGVPVNSEVRIASSLSYSTGVGSTGEVLGASTEAVEGAVLPAAGSSTWNLAVALLSLLFGFGLKALSVAVEKNRINTKRIRKGLKKAGVFLASLVLFLVLSTPLKAFSDYVYITKLDSYLNKENFYLSYSALSENPISAQFYVRKDGDATWRTLGSALTGASGQVEVKPADIYGGDAKYFFKVVINGGTASDETSTIIDRNAPDPVRDYRKEKLGDGHYKLYWRNPDNADYDRVKIYRSENKNFTADSSTEVATLWGTAGSEMTSESAAAPGKEYYFAIRAIDKAGNASSVVADPETQVTVVSSTVLGKTTEVSGTEEVKILPKEEKKGEVLGEEKAEGEEKAGETAPVESPKPQTAGVLGQAVQFAKDRTKLTLFIAFVLGLMSTLAFRALRKRKG